jgi:8-oxo-dGTP diphosphatase
MTRTTRWQVREKRWRETGRKVAVGEYLDVTEERRNDLHQISYCYVAKLMEDTGVLGLTDLEIGEGLKHQWVDVKEGLAWMRGCVPTSELGEFIKERGIYFIEIYLAV